MRIHHTARSAKQWLANCERFVRSYTSGLNPQDFQRLFDRDAVEAYDVLSRDRKVGEGGERKPPGDDLHRFLRGVKIVFLGLSYKLTPVRRLLFVGSILLALAGLFGFGPQVVSGGRLVLDASRLWFLLSVAGLVFLLALELVDQIRVRDELEVARQLQRDLLPHTAPPITGYSLAHSYRTANEVGGDYYDFPVLSDGRVGLLVGDASGHGMAAGLLMAIANACVQLALDLDPSPPAVLRLVNRTLLRTGDKRAFMSLFYALLEPGSGKVVFATAGHPFPMLRRRNGEIEELGEGGLPLGLRESCQAVEGATTIEPGDRLLLFSDGLAEAINQAGEPFGYERIRALLADGGSPERIQLQLLAAFDQHLGPQTLEDDFSLVVLGRDEAETE